MQPGPQQLGSDHHTVFAIVWQGCGRGVAGDKACALSRALALPNLDS